MLELAPGETLAEVLSRRPLSVEDALTLGRQIAAALEAAHEAGIVHRDLKPANVQVSREGGVKVLDFGLAKAVSPTPLAAEETRIASGASDRDGVVGTLHYMSPEQARGKGVDRRTDLWAFGCLLFEAVAGRRAFDGPTASDVMAAVLREEPDWTALPADTPPTLLRLLRRCLQKDPAQRLRDARDAGLAIEDALAETSGLESPALTFPRAARRRARLVWGTAGLFIGAAVAAGVVVLTRAPKAVGRSDRFLIAATPSSDFYLGAGPSLVIAPNGRRIAFIGYDNEDSLLYVRGLDETRATIVPNSRGARTPFFSPNSEWIGFIADGHLKKVPASGGEPQALSAAEPRGAAWGPDDRIIFVARAGATAFARIPAAGGVPEALTSAAQAPQPHQVRWPWLTPDGKAMVYTAWLGSVESSTIVAQSLETGESNVLLKGVYPVLTRTGYLLFGRVDGDIGSLWAIGFDARQLYDAWRGVAHCRQRAREHRRRRAVCRLR